MAWSDAGERLETMPIACTRCYFTISNCPSISTPAATAYRCRYQSLTAGSLIYDHVSFNSLSNVLVLKGVVSARSWLTEGTRQWSWNPCPLPPQVIELSVVKLRPENCFLLQKLFL